MKNIGIIIIVILIVGFGLTCVIGRKPFKKLDAESVESATVHLIPPDVTVVFKDGTETKISACNPIVTIDGVRYKCKYEPCEALNEFGNSFIDWLNEKPSNTGDLSRNYIE